MGVKNIRFVLITLLVLVTQFAFTQKWNLDQPRLPEHRLYFYWGWNLDWYSTSDITFSGVDYDFKLSNVAAKDRRSRFSARKHLHPGRATIPQYNFRVGSFIKERWDVSFGIDHMKYVVVGNQVVKIAGSIDKSQTKYDKDYLNEEITLDEDLLLFEHTDGLNYINLELRKSDQDPRSEKAQY